MYCLKCQKHREGAYCPECGSKLVEDPVNPIGGLHMGDANAITGGVHYSETNNVTNNITNNYTTVYEAQKTDAQIVMENEAAFFEAASDLFSGGILDRGKSIELEKNRIKLGISESRAKAIVESVRKNSSSFGDEAGSNMFAEDFIQGLKAAIDSCDVEYLRKKVDVLDKMITAAGNEELYYYYYLLSASFYPERVVVNYLSSPVDEYWLSFWAHVSYLKIKDFGEAAAIMNKLACFNRDMGDLSILMAVDCLYEKEKIGQETVLKKMEDYLEGAVNQGINPLLFPVWRELKNLSEHSLEERSRSFYLSVTFKSEVFREAFVSQPESASFNPQRVVLPQMQGFNPLEAAAHMGLGSINMNNNSGNDSNK